MAKTQTRKSVSLARPVYDALQRRAAALDMTMSHYLESLVRADVRELLDERVHYSPSGGYVVTGAAIAGRKPPKSSTRPPTLGDAIAILHTKEFA